jgi:4-hydroxythreonine-4-phosphate dehydrogenase
MTAPIAVSTGCPSGIGPEVAVVAAAAHSRDRILLVGDTRVVARAAKLRGIDPARFVRVDDPEDVSRLGARRVGVLEPTSPLADKDARPGKPSRAGGAAELAWIDAACDLTRAGACRAMVTGPVSKEAIARSGAKGAAGFIGHTEHLQQRLGAREVIMAFWTERFTTSLVTTHLALRDVPDAISPASVASATFWLADLLIALHRRTRRAPRIAIAGLNPHAGEHGLFGDEEPRILLPGMALARKRLRSKRLVATLSGPVPAETAFRVAGERYDGVVALYHDQATIPMKILGFGEAVNVTLGLPIVRTSVDHGTAYDAAGKGVADARGMAAAIALAGRLAGVAEPRSGVD